MHIYIYLSSDQTLLQYHLPMYSCLKTCQKWTSYPLKTHIQLKQIYENRVLALKQPCRIGQSFYWNTIKMMLTLLLKETKYPLRIPIYHNQWEKVNIVLSDTMLLDEQWVLHLNVSINEHKCLWMKTSCMLCDRHTLHILQQFCT